MRHLARALAALLALSASAECLAQAPAPAPNWDDSFYPKFNPAQFAGYRPANRKLDFKDIDYELLSAAIFYETNMQRLKHHKKPFVYSPALRAAAFAHAKDMAEKDFHGHVNPDDPKKETIAKRLELVGVTRCVMAENVAYVAARPYPVLERQPGGGIVKIDPANIPEPHTYVTFARSLVEGWMLSPPHKQNILSDLTGHLGCGAYYQQRQLLGANGATMKADCFKAAQNFASKRGPDKPAEK